MELSDLEEFHKICPKACSLNLNYSKYLEEYMKNILKFEDLTQIYFSSIFTKMPLNLVNNFLKDLKEDNKLEKIDLPFVDGNDQELCEFYTFLEQKVNLTSFERLNLGPKEFKLISSWIEKNSYLQKLNLNVSTIFSTQTSNFVQNDLNLIFNALKVNKSIKEFRIAEYSDIELNLKEVESLQFIQENSSIKSLNFSHIKFKENEIKILNECFMKNKSITNLDLSHSNFKSSFDFLQNNILEILTFTKIWDVLDDEDFNIFFQNLKSNQSLTELDLSFGYGEGNMDSKQKINKFIDFISEEGNIEHLALNYFFHTFDFHKLLKNSKLKTLRLVSSFPTENPKPIADLFKGLNGNTTLLELKISENDMNGSDVNWNEIQITNSSLELINISGKPIELNSGNGFDFSKNSNFFKNILNIPSLVDLNIKSNILGKNELKFLCEFLQTNTTLEFLSFSGKKNSKITLSGPELNDIEMMKLFKQSLMKNKKLTYLDFNGTL
jgi:hypothetical protein